MSKQRSCGAFSVADSSTQRPFRQSDGLSAQKGVSSAPPKVDSISCFDSVYIVHDDPFMPTVVQSCRIEKDHAALLTRQAKRRHLEVSTLSSLYLTEKALVREDPAAGE